ncbi:hypothetical protein A3Q56_00493 [Intoshia linei]|uniref:Uncharacterized protein n=1 Tax=Intoshia linei TaxID=1819745 RepID=A0A177BDW6_9BILA|nr:hypothetical protein A3Q56_00493 [Intoshia linei]
MIFTKSGNQTQPNHSYRIPSWMNTEINIEDAITISHLEKKLKTKESQNEMLSGRLFSFQLEMNELKSYINSCKQSKGNKST